MTDDDDRRVYPVDEKGTFWAIVPDVHAGFTPDEENEMANGTDNGTNGHTAEVIDLPGAIAAAAVELPDPVLTAADVLASLRTAEVANREAVDLMNWAVEKLIDADNVQLAAVFDARANELKRAASMCGMTAADVQLNFKDSDS